MLTHPHNLPRLPALLLLATLLPACQSPPKTAQNALNPPFYVPTAAFCQPPENTPNPRPIAFLRASDILPASDADALYAPRSEPFAYGPTPVATISAYTDYTFDAQQINTPGNSGWRYRYVVRQGVAFP